MDVKLRTCILFSCQTNAILKTILPSIILQHPRFFQVPKNRILLHNMFLLKRQFPANKNPPLQNHIDPRHTNSIMPPCLPIYFSLNPHNASFQNLIRVPDILTYQPTNRFIVFNPFKEFRHVHSC